MLDERAANIGRQAIDVALDERWEPLSREVLNITSQATLHHAYGGSRMLRQIISLYEGELAIQALMAWGHLQRALANVGIGQQEGLNTDLTAFMREVIETIAYRLLHHISDSPSFKNKQTNIIDPVEPLRKAKDRALNKIYVEIGLYVAALERISENMPKTGSSNVNIYGGSVGIVQTGDYSSASMTINLDDVSKSEILRALDAVEIALHSIQETPFNKAEVLELVLDAKTDAESAKPNVTRLRSMLIGIATSIQSVAALKPAYETVKGALALFGVQLP